MRIESRREFLKISAVAAGTAAGVGLPAAVASAAGRASEPMAPEERPPSKSFLDAVAEGDRSAVERWLSSDPGLIHARDETGKSAFTVALLAGHQEIGELLRARGYSLDLHEAALALDWDLLAELAPQTPGAVNQDHPVGGTAMLAAAAGGAGKNMWRVYQYAGDPNANPRGERGTTPLRAALDFPDLATAEMSAASMLSNGADPNLPQPGGRSPLHVAAERGSVEIVEYLLRKGANVALVDKAGRTAADAAEAAGQHATRRLLERASEVPLDCASSRAAYDVDGAPYTEPDLSAYAPLERERIVGASHRLLDVVRAGVERHPELAHAVATTTERAVEAGAHMGNRSIVDFLLDHGAPYSLPTAVMRNDLDRVKALLDEDPARIYERGAHDFALLWYAVIGGGWIEGAELLLDRGADVEGSHWMGTTALHYAAVGGDTQMIELFLEHGADVNRRGRKFAAEGHTPLDLAKRRDQTEAIALLQSHGAS